MNQAILLSDSSNLDFMIHGIVPIHNPIFGTVIACGVDGDEFADIPIDFNEWKALLCEWGN